MLRLKNCSVPEFKKEAGKKRIIPFGVGSWFKALEAEDLGFLAEQCPYAIDNNNEKSKVNLHGKEIPVCAPEKLKTEADCIVLLVSPVYMYDMYIQLEEMRLEGNITCYGFPFMTITDSFEIDEKLLKKCLRDKSQIIDTKIPRIIHGCWFSGEMKPQSYQKCFDSWKKICPNYDIREWTMDNYDIFKHPFLKKAIEVKAWAFASDFARLDILYQFGGFYLDMDVELIQSMDDLLDNPMVLGFAKSTTVDLAVIGVKPHHPLIKELLDKYDEISVPETREEFNACFQPSLVRDVIKKTGVRFNGQLQIMDDGTVFLPRTFFYPMDTVIFEKTALTKYTHAIHYDNFGWSVGGVDARAKKLRENRLLYAMIQK